MSASALTADLVAHAVIAAARVYGSDPIQAVEAKSGLPRRPVTAAALGLCRGLDLPERRLIRLFGLSASAIFEAKRRDDATFRRAAVAAETAARAARSVRVEPIAADPIAVEPRRPSQARLATVRMMAERQLATVRAPATAPRPVAPSRPLPEAAGSLRFRILDVLKDAPTTSSTLAILTDAKELAVIETLRVMEHEGKVIAGAIPLQGARHRQWHLNEGQGA